MSNTVNNYTETDLGNISLNPRGEYDSSVEYEYLDAVSYQGGSYFCLAELETTITGIAPDAGRNSEHWQMIAAPGDMTSEYTAAYNDVINKAAQVETSRAAVELAQQEIEAVQTDVQQLHSDTAQTAQEAENSKNSAANSAQSAEQSRKTVSESEQNINGQIAGFDSRVSEAVEQSKEEINTTKQQAINTITNQQTTSVNTVKTEGEKIITRVENDAKTVADDRATVEEATQTVLNNAQEVARNAQTVASNTKNAATSAEGAKTSADNAAQSAKSVEDASKQIEQNKKDVASLKEDIDIVRKKQNDLLQVDLKNGLDESTKKVGVYFNERNGEELQNVDHVIFEKYVEVEPNTTYTMWSDIGSTGTMKLCNDRIRFIFYNSNKEFEQGFNNIATVKTSENTRYIRVSMPSDYFGRTILKKGTEQPICEYIPFTEHKYLSDELTNNTIKAIVRPEIFRDKFGKYLPLTCFCQNYSIEDGFSAPIYALSVRDYSDNCQILFKSMDGGTTWERKGSIPINITNGEIISNIYVEPLQETLYVIKNIGTAGEENNKLISYDISSNSFSVIGELDIGKKYAHAYSHNFESAFLLDTTTPYTIFAEYGSGNDVEMYVWRTDDRGKTWKKMFTQGSRGGNGEIKHFHCVQYDPYRKELWLASGDTDAETKIWTSADDGLTWTLKYSGSQKTRTLGFVFEKDAIYYGMDSPQPEEPSHLYRINRNGVSGIALDDIQSVGISKNGWAIYNITKMIIPSGILIFSVYERANDSIPNNQYCIEFYDYSKKTIITVGTFDISKETGGYVGVMYAPRYQDMISGKVFFNSIMNLFGICSELPKSVYSPIYSLTLTV